MLGIAHSLPACSGIGCQNFMSKPSRWIFCVWKQATLATLIVLAATGAEARGAADSGAFQSCLKTYSANSMSEVDLNAANFACTCIVKEVRGHLDRSEFKYFEELEKLMASNVEGAQLSNELERFSSSMGDSLGSGKAKFRHVGQSIDLALEVCRSKS